MICGEYARPLATHFRVPICTRQDLIDVIRTSRDLDDS